MGRQEGRVEWCRCPEKQLGQLVCDSCRISVALPTSAAERKAIPVFSGVLRYFPKAIAAVAELSRIGNDQHNPGQPLHWDRSKSTDELDALTRHLLEAGTVDTDGVLHAAKVAWRALANLEKELEARASRESIGTLPPGEPDQETASFEATIKQVGENQARLSRLLMLLEEKQGT